MKLESLCEWEIITIWMSKEHSIWSQCGLASTLHLQTVRYQITHKAAEALGLCLSSKLIVSIVFEIMGYHKSKKIKICNSQIVFLKASKASLYITCIV